MNAETSPATHTLRPPRAGGMALRLLAVVALTLTLTISPALAKKKKKKKKKKAVSSSQIKKTQIESFDAVFTKAKLMDNKVISAERRVAKSKKALQTALKLSKKQTYKDCIRELKKYKKHVKMVQKGKVPRLTIKSTAPKKMKKDLKKAIKSINTLMDNMPAAVVDLKDAAAASVELSKEAKKFPNELKTELSQMGEGGLWAMVTTLPKTGRIIMKNLKIMGTIPRRSANTTKELADISSTIVKTFK